MEMLSAIASPIAAVVCRLDDSQPKRGGMHEKAPHAATIRQPYRCCNSQLVMMQWWDEVKGQADCAPCSSREEEQQMQGILLRQSLRILLSG